MEIPKMKASQYIAFWSQLCVIVLLFMFGIIINAQSVEPTAPPLTRTIYLDTDFSMYDEEVFIEATDEWKQATNGMVDYTIKRLPDKKMELNSSTIIVEKVSENSPEVLELDYKHQTQTLAYYNHTEHVYYIALVDSRITNSIYKQAVLHEIGHSLGLVHPEQPDPPALPVEEHTLMFPLIEGQSAYISLTDLYHFCEIHHCNPWILRDQEESSNF